MLLFVEGKRYKNVVYKKARKNFRKICSRESCKRAVINTVDRAAKMAGTPPDVYCRPRGHSETDGKVIVYHYLHGDQNIWVRAKEMFIEMVDVNVNV